jgi:hypothetical protein
MDHKKILKGILYVISLMIIFLILHWLIFYIPPTKATVESFLKENSCNPSATETDSDSEHYCAYYLRRHTTLVFGQIINVPEYTLLFAYTPFVYFIYDPIPGDDWGCSLTHSCKNDEHVYIFVVTRDEGPLVYNPVNGNFIDSYNNLMLEMGCKVQPNENPFFSSQFKKYNLQIDNGRCYSNITMQNILIHQN